MKSYLLYWVMIFSLVCGNIHAADYWKKTNGPYGASISSIVANDSTDDIYISTLTSGVFYKKNNESKWVNLNDDLMKSNSRVNSIYLRANGDLIALTDSLGILKKTPAGTWEYLNIGLGGHQSFKSILKIKENTFIVGSLGRAIFRTTNNGDNWSNYNTGLLPDENINSLCLVQNIIFAGSDRGIYKSSDEGKKWLKVNDETGKVNKIYFDEISNTLLAITSKGVIISKDSGINWLWANTGLNAETNVLSFEKFNDKFYIGTLNDGLKYSSIETIDWKTAPENLNIEFVQSMKSINNNLFIGTSRAFFQYANDELYRVVTGLSINNVNNFVESGGVLFTATDNGIYKSTNFGFSWEAMNKGLDIVTKINCLVTSQDDKLIAGTEEGLYYFDNIQSSWIKYSVDELNHEKITNLVVDSIGTVYAGTISKGVWKTSEDRWLQVNGGSIETQEILSLIVVDSNYIYAGSRNNGLYRKAPFDEWRVISPIDVGINSVTALEFNTLDSIILAATNLGVYRSRDNGFTWAKTQGILSSQVNSIISLSNDTVMVGLKNVPGVFRTLDNGDTWSGLYDQSGISKFKVTNFFVSKSGFVFAGTKEGGCFRSTSSSVDFKPEPPVLDLIGKKEFCEGEFCVLDAGNGYIKYNWSDGSSARYDTVWTKGKYWVKVENDFGFSANSDTVLINVEQKPAKPNILYNGEVLFCPANAARYVWYLDNELIESANQKTYEPLQSGWYKCEIFTDLNCNAISDEVRVELTNINDNVSSESIIVYPNPASDFVWLDFSKNGTNILNSEMLSISLKNLSGVEVLNIVSKLNLNNPIKLEIGSLVPGIYIVHCKISAQNYYIKLIKN